MEYSAFYVGRRPLALWDPALGEKNLQFLRGIDSSYYSHISRVHEPLLSGESKLQAAAALRIAYSQGIETLMALACAAMQAPDCVVGWMMLYQNQELRHLVQSVSRGKVTDPIHPSYSPGSWGAFVHHMFGGAQCDDEFRAGLETKFGRVFARFASDFLDEKQQQEYNSLKHGGRPLLGGFHMSVGVQPEARVLAPPEAMVSLGGSDFGSTFFTSERVGESKLHLRLNEVSINWVPENFVEGLILLSMSITNVVSFLKAQAGEPIEECPLSIPDEDFMYDLPWAKHCGLTTGTFRPNFDSQHTADWDEDRLRELINERWA